jgi:aldose 1-epimerase
MSLIKVPCMQITNMHCSGQTVSLAAGDYHATIVTVGAGLAELTFQGCHLVIPHKPEEMPLAHLGKVLIPWPNRIANGCYRYQGQEYQLPINEHSSKAAIHGLLAWRDWQISDQRYPDSFSAAQLRLSVYAGFTSCLFAQRTHGSFR